MAYAYDDAGRMTTATLPASTGIVSTYAYDNADRLTGIAHVQNGSTTIASVAYTLDAVGNRTQRVDQQGTHTYAYDNLYRLTSVTYPGPSTTSYAFDAFGNRTSMTDGTGTTAYAYDDAERLTSVTPPTPAPAVNYTWDNNGDLTARGSDSFAWDYEDRMTSATVNSVTTTFAYRGDGLRNSRTTGGVTTGFTWDISRGLPVVLDDGNQYVYGAGLSSMVTATSTYYYLADGLGSTMAIVDTSGTVQKSYTYDVYGKPTGSGSLSNEFDFAGQQTDPTGLQYLRARYYDPATGRFISRDPLAKSPSWSGHPFSYVDSDPTNATDPLGLCKWYKPWECGGEAWGAVSGASSWVVSQVESLGKPVVDWVKNVGWNAARAALNAELTGAGWAIATYGLGASCSIRSDLLWICTGAKGFAKGAALTIGNVIITGEKSEDKLRPGLLEHEIAHADQWAILRLKGGLPAQAWGGLTYILNLAIDNALGANGCTLIADWIDQIQSGDRGGHCE